MSPLRASCIPFDRDSEQRQRLHNHTRRVVLTVLTSVVLAHLLDPFFYHYVRVADIYEHDWGRALRVLGFAPTWLVAALALYLHDRPKRFRALFLVGAVAVSGILGELLKLVFRRERPGAHDGEYFFRSFADRPFHSGGLALPSTHAIVAFGAAAALARLFPRARLVFWGIAWGCALSRVAAGAHFFSDVVVAAVVAWVTTDWLLRLSTRGKIHQESSR